MADFSEEVTKWCQGQGERADLVFRGIAVAAVNRVKELTPVDTGFLRSNWTVVKEGDPEPVPGRVPDPMRAIASAHVGDKLIILNPTVYARRIEYGFVGEDSKGRHYNQPGAHMMQQTIAELPSIAAEVVSRLGG